MIRKRSYSDIGLYTLHSDCSHCSHANEYTFAEDYEGTMGAVCGNCNETLWFFRMGNPITARTHAPSPKGMEKENKEKIGKEFFQILPACPACHAHRYSGFAMDFLAKAIDCRNCGKEILVAEFKDASVKKFKSKVFWFEPDEP
jgi:hypothetical protein